MTETEEPIEQLSFRCIGSTEFASAKVFEVRSAFTVFFTACEIAFFLFRNRSRQPPQPPDIGMNLEVEFTHDAELRRRARYHGEGCEQWA